MKKTISILLILLVLCFSLAACNIVDSSAQATDFVVYSFSGANDQFTVCNGVIVISDTEDVFYGGDFSVKQADFSNIVEYSTTFYIISGSEKRIIVSNSVVDTTGNTVNVAGDLGKASGEGLLSEYKLDDVQNLNNLYFELTTTDINGQENIYQLQLAVTEITKSIEQ